MYWDLYNCDADARSVHGEIIPVRRLTERYIELNTEVRLADVEAAIADVGRGVIELGRQSGHMKFGGYMLGGRDEQEATELDLLDRICSML